MNTPARASPETAPPARPWRVLLVDDHPVVREGLAQRIGLEPDLAVCATCESISLALEAVEAFHPDLAIVDLTLPNGHGLDFIKEIHARHPAVRLLVFSMHDEQTYGERALLSGAHGYVMKDESPDHVLEAIREVLAGKISISPHLSERLLQSTTSGRRNPQANKLPMDRLSDRELEVLEWLGQGLSVKTIAQRLQRSSKTIETHRQRLKDKLRIKSNSELIAHAACWVRESSGPTRSRRDHGRRPGRKSARLPAK